MTYHKYYYNVVQDLNIIIYEHNRHIGMLQKSEALIATLNKFIVTKNLKQCLHFAYLL
jgi:hypothetical protein